MNSSTGLRRFVSGPPSAAHAGAVPTEVRPEPVPNKPVPTQAAPTQAAPTQAAPTQAAPAQAVLPQAVRAPAGATEKCDLCATEVAAEHGHLADLDQSSLMCACRACYLLFTRTEAVRGRYRAVPDRYLADPDHPLSAAEWDELEIPVGLAFFLRSSRQANVTGFYPSPAGATECRLDLAAWDRLSATHPLLGAAEPDVEAVLITRPGRGDADAAVDGGTAIECFVVPIDACYELAGKMRLLWRGFDGGSEARGAIAEFLGNVRARARIVDQET